MPTTRRKSLPDVSLSGGEAPVNILIVDDDQKNLTVLEAILDDPGYRVVRAESAEQALLALLTDEFALAILDIRMPGMTGFELAEMMKTREKTSKIPIIFLTAYYTEAEYSVRSYQVGAVDYLSKPVDPAALRSKVSVFAELHRERTGLEQINRSLAAVVQSSDDGIISQDLNGTIATFNPGAERLFGYKAEEVVGKPITTLIPPDRQHEEMGILARIRRGERINHYETVRRRKDGTLVDISLTMSPVADGQDKIIGASKIARDITERKRVEERLRESEERLRFIVERAQVCYWHWEIASDRHEWSPLCNQLFGISPEEPRSYARLLAAIYPDDRERTVRAVQACLEAGGQTDFDIEYRALRPDKTVRWIHAKGNASFEDGKAMRMAGLALDITERKAHEEHVQFLMREVNHRAKNMLSVVDAIAHQTAANSPEDFLERFSERIRALSANQELLVRNAWEGVDVEELVHAQLAHFAGLIGSRIVVDGPKLRFNTVGAQAIGLALHELATNASKYGALSTDRGRVNVGWKISGDAFTLSWAEREGPPVSAPKQRGFGTMVLERMAESSLGGTVELNYAPSGLTWYLTCPAGHALERRYGDRVLRGRQIEPRVSTDLMTILERLRAARRHVATGERNIARQRKIVARLERDGHVSLEAKRLLARFEELQKLHVADRDRLETELAEISK